MQTSNESPRVRSPAVDTDPYSPVLVQELLQGSSEWSQIHDIVKLTFKAVLDVMRAHSDAIREMERMLPSKATKAELAAGLSQKAAVNDVTKTVAEVAANIESRATLEEVQQLLESTVSKADLQYALSNKVGIEEMQSAIEEKANIRDVENSIKQIQEEIEKIRDECQQSMEVSVGIKEIEELKRELKEKAGIKEVAEGLSSKASKESVASALNRKANRDEVSAELAKKAEIEDLKKISNSLEEKLCSREFDEVNEVVAEQEKKILGLQNTLKEKANSQEIIDFINETIDNSKIDNDKKLLNFEKELNTIYKKTKGELEKFGEELAIKAEGKNLAELNEIIRSKVDSREMIDNINKLRKGMELQLDEAKLQLSKKLTEATKAELAKGLSEIGAMKNDLKRIKSNVNDIADEQQKQLEETQKNIKSVATNMQLEKEDSQRELKKEIATLKKNMDAIAEAKCDKKDVQTLKIGLQKSIDNKANGDDMDTIVANVRQEAAKNLIDLVDKNNKTMKSLEEKLISEIKNKSNTADVLSLLDRKAEKSTVFPLLERKADAKEVEDIKSMLNYLQNEISNKANAKDFKRISENTKEVIEDIRQELAGKAATNDVCALFDTKVNSKDFNKGIDNLEGELMNKADTEELKTAIYNQAVINKALSKENCTARWIWESGRIKSGYAVPWEDQAANTCPENFVWEKDCISIIVVASGMYELTLGFFSSKNPVVKVLVNGESVLAPVNTSRYICNEN